MNPPAFRLLCPVAVIGLALLSTSARAVAQGAENVAAVVASLREDIRVLDERTRALTAEIQQLRRDNEALRQQAAANTNTVTIAQLNTAINDLERTLRAQDQQVALDLSQKLERLATQTKTAIDALARAGAGAPVSTPEFKFADDFPKTGTTYVVQPGDTISSIAQKLGSTVRDIQNANRIAEAKTLQAGQTIFVPQRK